MSDLISAFWISARFIKLTCGRVGLLTNARSLVNLISNPVSPKGITLDKADVKLPVAFPTRNGRSNMSGWNRTNLTSSSLKSLKTFLEISLSVILQRKRIWPNGSLHRPTRASLSTEKVKNPQGEVVDMDPNSVSLFCTSNRHNKPVEWETARRFLSGEHWKQTMSSFLVIRDISFPVSRLQMTKHLELFGQSVSIAVLSPNNVHTENLQLLVLKSSFCFPSMV